MSRIVFAFEASGQGFGLSDEFQAAGLECPVLAPSKLPQSRHARTRKTDPQVAVHDPRMVDVEQQLPARRLIDTIG